MSKNNTHYTKQSEGIILHGRNTLSKAICSILVFSTLIFSIVTILNRNEAFAATQKTWDFSDVLDYTISDSDALELSGGQAQLKETGTPAWYDSDWKYRKAITIDNTGGGALTDYQVPITLNAGNYDSAKALGQGEDIRFTDTDGTTEINSWIENWYKPVLNEYPQRASSVGYWHLDSQASAYDSSGAGSTGTYQGAANIDQNTLALTRANSTDYVSILDSASLDANSSFTIEAWVNPSSLPSGDNDSAGIVSKGGVGEGATVDHNYWLALAHDSVWGGAVGDGVTFGFEDNLGGNHYVSLDNTSLPLGEWSHVAGVFNDTGNKLELYLNGALINTASNITATPNQQNQAVEIGRMPIAGGTTYFDGKIDEVRITKSALSGAQVSADYSASKVVEDAKIWAKVPSIGAGVNKTIYMYYGLNDNPNLEAGIITDVHGVADSDDKKGSFATTYIGEFVDRMNNTVNPDFTVELGDKISGINNETDKTHFGTIKNAFDGLNNPHYYISGNHDLANVSRAEMQTALGIDYSHKSIDFGDYHIITVDSQDGTVAGSISNDEKTWLTAELAATEKKTLVFVHQSLDNQSVVLNGYFAGGADGSMSNAADIRAILESDGDVAGVFQGHAHWDNLKTINNIPYFTINSLVEDYSKEWAEFSIYNNRFLNVVYRQGSLTKKVLIWDFVNNRFYNKADQVFDFYDDFDGDSGQWSEVAGRDTGTWQIEESGQLTEINSASVAHKILKSNFTESTNYIAEVSTKIRAPLATSGFATRIADADNFNALYLNESSTDADDTYRWKQMAGGVWSGFLQIEPMAEDFGWRTLKMVKEGDVFSLYDNDVSAFSGSETALEDGSFGVWNYNAPIIYDNLKIRKYTAIEPTDSVGAEILVYDSGDPSIEVVEAAGQSFTSVSGFTESATKNSGEIKYQISNDAGTTWYWWTGGAWTETVAGYAEANTAAEINGQIGLFTPGDFVFRSYFHSDGTQNVILDAITLTYDNDTSAPVISVVRATPANTTAAITWHTNENASSQVEYGETDSYGTTTVEADTDSRVKDHTVNLSSLTACSTYHFRVISVDSSTNTATGDDGTFTTTGCTTSPEAEEESSVTVTSSSSSAAAAVVRLGAAIAVLSAVSGQSSTPAVTEDQTEATVAEGTQSELPKTVTVTIKLVDKKGNPLAGVKATLYSEPREATTNDQGIATYPGVPVGQHRVVLSYRGKTVERAIEAKASANNADNEIKVTIETKPDKMTYIVWGLLITLIIAGFVVALSWRSKQK